MEYILVKNIKELREESKGLTRMLWHHNYWDGPISGVMLWNGEYCWFQQTGDDVVTKLPYTEEERKDWIEWCEKEGRKWDDDELFDYESYRIYNVYNTPKDVMDAIKYNHDLFTKYVGLHTDYDLDGNRPIGELRPYEDHGNFYNNKESHRSYDLDLNKLEIMGKFKY